MTAVPEKKISEASRLDLFSVRRFEALLGRPLSEIRLVAANAGAYYKPFPKPPKSQRLFSPSINETAPILPPGELAGSATPLVPQTGEAVPVSIRLHNLVKG